MKKYIIPVAILIIALILFFVIKGWQFSDGGITANAKSNSIVIETSDFQDEYLKVNIASFAGTYIVRVEFLSDKLASTYKTANFKNHGTGKFSFYDDITKDNLPDTIMTVYERKWLFFKKPLASYSLGTISGVEEFDNRDVAKEYLAGN